MKILVITSEYPNSLVPNRASFNRQHLNALADRHDVAVFCPVSWRSRIRVHTGMPTKPENVSRRIPVIYASWFYPPGIARGTHDLWMWLSIKRRLLRFARQQRPDLVLGIWTYPDGGVATRLARHLKLPVAVQALGSDINLLEKYPAKKRKTLATLQRADAVLPVSRALAKAIESMGVDRSKVSVVYRGVNSDLFCPRDQGAARHSLGLCPGVRHFLFIGNLVHVKNPRLLLRAFLAASFGRDVALHIVGEGPLRAELEALANSASASQKVVFHGSVLHEMIPVWLAAVDALVLSSDAEGVPNVLLEARSIGCPYIATAVGGVAEVSDHAGAQLVPARDEDALRQALETFASNPPGRSEAPWQSWDSAGEALATSLCRIVQWRSRRELTEEVPEK